MTDSKKTTADVKDSGEAEVQKIADEANEKGYIGSVPPGPPNEAYSLQSGPDSPTVAEEAAIAAASRVDARYQK